MEAMRRSLVEHDPSLTVYGYSAHWLNLLGHNSFNGDEPGDGSQQVLNESPCAWGSTQQLNGNRKASASC
ncbi:hypothetical protein DPMN_105729 [Dreissena polymorpha]|uniref:Uncharacterized protein n=1 Tax=Dreissena polymorpha TaxID=45954 RepID=A0A9D4QJ08_DREPO|nr:hypothetical protein DPMN_105729 [Dreissena polymorpha]